MVLLARPTAPPPPDGGFQDNYGRGGSWWHAPNGVTWPLHMFTPETPPVQGGGAYLMPGAEGVHAPQYATHSTSTLHPGQVFRGARALPREVFMPITLWADSPTSFVHVDKLFKAGLQPDPTQDYQDYGVWEWKGPSGGSRFLRCRYDELTEAPDRDATKKCRAVYGVVMVADQPYWEGAPVTRRFEATTPRSWLPTGTEPMWISAGSSLATASIQNTGEVPVYPTWRAEGPASDVSVGIGDRMIDMPWLFNTAGQWMEIHTSPDSPRGFGAWDNTGANRTSDMSRFEPEPVPPGGEVPLVVEMTGTGNVTATVTPRFRWAW